MANFYLDTNGTSELGQSSSPVRVNGTAGDKDRILLLSNAANVTVGPAVEIIDFAGSVADYAFVQAAGGIAVYRGDTLVASLASNPDTSELRFAEGGLTLEQTAEGPFALGGQEITAEKAAYTGNGMLTGEEHQSQAGTNGPAGKGLDYLLPQDYLPGNIIRSDDLSNTYTTEMNGLVSKAQIIDASTADDDVLVLNYNARNLNGSIVNVETIQARWDGGVDGEFDAKQVTHSAPGGTNIVVSNLRSVAKGFVVDDVRGNSVTAGDGVTGILAVKGIKGGGTIDVNDNGATLKLGGSGNTLVTATKDFGLQFGVKTGGTTEEFITTKAKVLTIRSDQDITINRGGGADSHQWLASPDDRDGADGAHIQAAGKGKIVLKTWMDGTAAQDDIANMKGFDAIGVNADDPNAEYIVSKGQTVLFRDNATGATTRFHTDGREYNVELGLRADERQMGVLSIRDGHPNDAPNMNQVSRLAIETNGNPLTIEDLLSDGVAFTDKGAMEAGADTFAISGADNVLVKDVSQGGVIDAAKLDGKLTVGGDGKAGNPAPVPVGSHHHSLAISTGKGGGEAHVGDVKEGLFFYQGGEGADSVAFHGELNGANVVNNNAATVHLGAGADTVVFAAGSKVADNTKVDLDFGEGEDVLDVRDSVRITDSRSTISGLGVLKIADNKVFTVASTALGLTPAFKLESDGLVIWHNIRGRELNLSGITAPNAGVKPVVTVMVKQDNAQAAGTVVCNDALSEVIQVLGSSTSASDLVTVKGFVAGGSADRIEFASDETANQNKPLVKDGNNNFHAGETLAQVKAGVTAGTYAFFKDGTDTYVVANLGTRGDGTADISVVRLEGTGYTQSLLGSSVEPKVAVPGRQEQDVPSHVIRLSEEARNTPEVMQGETIKGTFGNDEAHVDRQIASGDVVRFDLGNGNDRLIVEDTAKPISGTLVVDMGPGNDEAVFQAGGSISGGTVTLKGGQGTDKVTVDADFDITSGGKLEISTDEGASTVDLQGPIGSISSGSVAIEGGADADTVTIANVGGSGSVTVKALAGQDRITIAEVASGGRVTVEAGMGDDEFILGDAGSGDGVVSGATVALTGGAGYDTLTGNAGSKLSGTLTLTGIEKVDLSETTFSGSSGAVAIQDTSGSVSVTLGKVDSSSAVAIRTSGAGINADADLSTTSGNGAITVSGSSGSDILTLSGGVASGAEVTFSGDAGSDRLIINGDIASGAKVTFSGGSGADVVTINGDIVSSVSGAVSINAGNESGDTITVTGAITAGAVSGAAVALSGSSIEVKDVITAGTASGANVTITGTSGNDTIKLADIAAGSGSGGVTVSGGSGADTITVGAITTGSGSGGVTIDAGGQSGDTITVGSITAGTDDNGDVTLSGASSIKVTGLIETTGSGDVTIAAGNSGSTITLGDIKTVANGNVTISGGSGGDTVTLGAISGAGNVTVSGGDAADTVTFNGVIAGANVTVNGGSGATTVTVDKGIASGGKLTVSGAGAATDSLDVTVKGGLAGTLEVTGGSGADVVKIDAVKKGATLTLNTGSGNDTVTLGDIEEGLAAAPTINLGDGDDKIFFEGRITSSTGISVSGDSGNDTFDITDKASLDGRLTFNGGSGDDTFKVGISVLNGSVLTLDGGAGDDTFELNKAITADAISISGGAGTNTVKFGEDQKLDGNFDNVTFADVTVLDLGGNTATGTQAEFDKTGTPPSGSFSSFTTVQNGTLKLTLSGDLDSGNFSITTLSGAAVTISNTGSTAHKLELDGISGGSGNTIEITSTVTDIILSSGGVAADTVKLTGATIVASGVTISNFSAADGDRLDLSGLNVAGFDMKTAKIMDGKGATDLKNIANLTSYAAGHYVALYNKDKIELVNWDGNTGTGPTAVATTGIITLTGADFATEAPATYIDLH